MRNAELRRQTGETDIYCWMDLDDPDGTCSVATGVGFFDHMLQLLAFHSGFGAMVLPSSISAVRYTTSSLSRFTRESVTLR